VPGRARVSSYLDASKQVPGFFVASPVFAGFLAAIDRVFTFGREINIRDVPQMTQWNDVELHLAAVFYYPQRKLGSLGLAAHIETHILAPSRSQFMALANLNAAKRAVHKHHPL